MKWKNKSVLPFQRLSSHRASASSRIVWPAAPSRATKAGYNSHSALRVTDIHLCRDAKRTTQTELSQQHVWHLDWNRTIQIKDVTAPARFFLPDQQAAAPDRLSSERLHQQKRRLRWAGRPADTTGPAAHLCPWRMRWGALKTTTFKYSLGFDHFHVNKRRFDMISQVQFHHVLASFCCNLSADVSAHFSVLIDQKQVCIDPLWKRVE